MSPVDRSEAAALLPTDNDHATEETPMTDIDRDAYEHLLSTRLDDPGDPVEATTRPRLDLPNERVATALDYPDCRACARWEDAGASWPRPCAQHYTGEQRG